MAHTLFIFGSRVNLLAPCSRAYIKRQWLVLDFLVNPFFDFHLFSFIVYPIMVKSLPVLAFAVAVAAPVALAQSEGKQDYHAIVHVSAMTGQIANFLVAD